MAELTARVFRLEKALNLHHGVAVEAPAAAKTSSPAREPKVRGYSADHVTDSCRTPDLVSKAECPDLESRIGSHWLNRIGITAVLIGVSYFLKFAFDNDWIGPTGRVAIGLLAGIAVVVWSETFRRRGYRVFSYSLKAVGIGVLYLSLYAAFQVYNLIPSSVAFMMMFAVTAATAVMAWTQDAEVLAAFALIGGFSTPLLLSTGQNREVALFAYVAILDLGALALLILKPWRRLLILSYVGTLSLYVGWYSSFYDLTQLRMTVGFATLFFAIFAVAPMVTLPAEKGRWSDLVPPLIAVINAAGYFLQIYIMFEEIGTKDTAWFALALAALYVFLSRKSRVRAASAETARTVDLLHLALAMGFITVAIPIRLDAHWVTMGWFVEAAILLWVADRIHSELLNAFVLGALALGVGRLLLIDNFYITTPIFNTRMATYVTAIVVLGAVAWFGSRRKDASWTHRRHGFGNRFECSGSHCVEPRSCRLLQAANDKPASPGSMEPRCLGQLASSENCPRLYLLGALDVLRCDADDCWFLAAFGFRALASAGVDRLHHRQSLPLRRFGTRPRIPHCELHRAGSFAAGHFICLSTRLAQAG